MSSATDFDPKPRRASVAVDVGGVIVGGGAPVVVQSMTNTDTADIDATVAQVAALFKAGSEMVRITVDRDESAAAVPKIRERLLRLGMDVPLIGDFHYIGHKLLADHPACAEALAKYRINPGNVGFKDKKDKQFGEIVEMAIRYDKPVRIGVNWGSLDQELLTTLMDKNKEQGFPLSARQVTREAIVQSALISAELAEEIGLPRNRIILSAKVSQVQDLIACYSMLSQRSNHALHLGDFRCEVLDMGKRQLLHRGAGAPPVAPERQQLADRFQREAQGARAMDEAQGMHFGLVIEAVAGICALCLGQQADRFIMADHLGRNAAGPGCIADRLHRIILSVEGRAPIAAG